MYNELIRVWNVTRKPTKKDYFLVLKIVLVGVFIIGLVGFIIYLLFQLLINRLFI